jgi:type II secretory pathway pseudopilin PulG
MKTEIQFIAMQLRGQHGYAMAALLVGLSVAAILMTAAMPAWKQMARREKESELIFRGQQYARAIGLFQRRSGPGVLPPNLDVLVQGRFLRKKYKDPITGEDFDLLTQTQAAPNAGGRGDAPNTQQQAGRGGAPGFPNAGSLVGARPGTTGPGAAGGIVGVASKSKQESLRVYNGRTRYNEWQFIYVAQTQAPGAANGPNGPGGILGPGGRRGGGPGSGGIPPIGNPTRGGPGTGPGRDGQGGDRGPGGGQQPIGGGRGFQPSGPFPGGGFGRSPG